MLVLIVVAIMALINSSKKPFASGFFGPNSNADQTPDFDPNDLERTRRWLWKTQGLPLLEAVEEAGEAGSPATKIGQDLFVKWKGQEVRWKFTVASVGSYGRFHIPTPVLAVYLRNSWRKRHPEKPEINCRLEVEFEQDGQIFSGLAAGYAICEKRAKATNKDDRITVRGTISDVQVTVDGAALVSETGDRDFSLDGVNFRIVLSDVKAEE